MSVVGAIAGVELRRFLRDKSNIFFTFIFPLLLVVVIGAQFGGGASNGRVLLTETETSFGQDLQTTLGGADVSVDPSSAGDAAEALARGRADVAIIISPEDVAAYDAGEPVEVEVIQASTNGALTTAQRVQTALNELATTRAQLTALTDAGADPDVAAQAVQTAEQEVPPLEVEVIDVNEISQAFAGATGFDVGAASQVLLFVFMAALAGSGTLIDARRNGVIARTLAAPVGTGSVVAGQALGRWVIAAFQGVYVMAGTTLLFGVTWGSLPVALLVVAVFAAVAAGFAMVIGSLLDNEGAATGLGVGLSLVLAALGGCMFPQELFPDTLRTVSSFTPHGWGYRAFAEVQRHDAGVAEILPHLGVLAAFAAGALLLGSLLLRRSLGRSI
ncbi:ABC transporter permease [Ruania alba]|uniref:ABC-2 type transport system permease protein n=1 Tax=Ruania alba TaxID=648782 RepID=A0A1H5CZJ5_9MICO|nr:ABC transporter permease [Ruania alba]SED72047.1 ABC-2 type transport system permease protein [Ruania alba]